MDLKTLKRLADGDEKARQQLKKWLEGLSEEEETAETAAGGDAAGGDAGAGDDEAGAAPRFWSDLAALKTAVDSAPGATAAAIEQMAERADRLGSCERVQVLNLRSYRLRVLGDLDSAEQLLLRALAVGGNCPMRAARDEFSACHLEVEWRLGVFEAAIGRGEVGLRRVERARVGYEILGHPGHDLDRDGIASCTYARGVIRGHLGDHAGAAADFGVCLDRYLEGSAVWERAHQDFTTALANGGLPTWEKAWELQERRRRRICKRAGTTEYAYFYWTDGQLGAALGKQRSRKKMKVAMTEFAAQGMPDEVIGVGHDIALDMFPNRDLIRSFFAREFLPLTRGLVKDPRQKQALNDVIGLLRGSPQPETTSRLRGALQSLRAAAGAHLPPCLTA